MDNAPNSSTSPSAAVLVVTAAYSRLLRALRELNLFSDHPFWSPILNFAEQILITRLFLFFVSVSLLIVIVYTSLSVRTHEVTLERFSLNDFEQLEALYPTTISVPCTQLSIPYDRFVQLSPRFHRVCSSPFVRQKWISSLFLPNATSHNILDFRTFAFAQFRALGLLCRTARQAVTDAQRTFASTHLVTSHALTREQFSKIVDVVVTNFQRNIEANERRTALLTSLSIAENRVLSALRTNYYIQSVPGSRAYLMLNGAYPRKNETTESTCFCRLEGNRCIHPAGLFDKWTPPESLDPEEATLPPHIQIPGLMAGCLPLDSLRQSTLECVYNQSCVDLLTLRPHFARPRALNGSSSRFLVNTTVRSLFDQFLFLESWNSTLNYDEYFASCAPRSLSYSYEGRFHLATIFAISVSAFGGLILAWQLVTPIIVKVWKRWIWRRRQRRPVILPQPSTVEEIILSRAPRPINEGEGQNLIEESRHNDSILVVIAHAHRTIYTFNVFPSDDDDDDPEEQRVGIIATRLYILCLWIGLVILGFYTSFTTHIQTYTIQAPSLALFEELHSLHASTLQCPCSRTSMSYGRIMSVSPRYHQVCTSEFLEDYWLSYFGQVQLEEVSSSFLTPDFRVSGQSFFELLNIFCKATSKTVQNALDVFRLTRLFTANAISREQFDLQTSTRSKQFEQHITSSFLDLTALMHSAIETNRLVTEMLMSASPISSFDNQTSTWSLGFRARRFYANSCSCALSNRCSRPIGFYFQSDTVRAQPNVTVPGLVVACYPIDSFLLSTLECLFDRQCLQRIVDLYDFDVVGLVRPLDARAVRISPLSHSDSRFQPNSTLEEIVSELFVEEWVTSNDYTHYYTRCAPLQCTYSDERRFDMMYMITMMLGFYGGLSVVLEVILPPMVKLVRRWWRKRRERLTADATSTVTRDAPSTRASINLFPVKSSSTDPQLEHQEVVATRVYLVLFILSLVAAVLYAGPFTDEIDTSVIASPTADVVNSLHAKHISTLSCPCSTAAVSYATFLRITPEFHPLCSSQFTSVSYWSHFSDKDDNVSLALSAHYRLLASLCAAADRIIEHTKEAFGARELVSVETATHSSFETQSEALVSTFITRIPADFRRTLSFMVGAFEVNQLINVFTSNWKVRLTNAEDYHLIGTHPRPFSSSNCSCATSSDCREQLAENLFSGCFPYDGFRLSKLENVSIAPLIDKLFVDMWHNESNYTAYFEACRPSECRYTVPDRCNLIYMLVTVLGLYGGLRYGLRLIVGQTLLAYRWWTKHIRRQ